MHLLMALFWDQLRLPVTAYWDHPVSVRHVKTVPYRSDQDFGFDQKDRMDSLRDHPAYWFAVPVRVCLQ